MNLLCLSKTIKNFTSHLDLNNERKLISFENKILPETSYQEIIEVHYTLNTKIDLDLVNNSSGRMRRDHSYSAILGLFDS